MMQNLTWWCPLLCAAHGSIAVLPAITLTSITESLKIGPGKFAVNTETRRYRSIRTRLEMKHAMGNAYNDNCSLIRNKKYYT